MPTCREMTSSPFFYLYRDYVNNTKYITASYKVAEVPFYYFKQDLKDLTTILAAISQ